VGRGGRREEMWRRWSLGDRCILSDGVECAGAEGEDVLRWMFVGMIMV